MKLAFWQKDKPADVATAESKDEAKLPSRGFFSTDTDGEFMPEPTPKERIAQQMHLQRILQRSFQRDGSDMVAVDASGAAIVGANAPVATLDDAYSDLSLTKLLNSTGSFLPSAQLEYFAQGGFIGWQTCALLSQHWLIQKACAMPAQDAIRNGWDIGLGDDVNPEIFKAIKRADRKFKIKRQARAYVTNGRVFGIRLCWFKVDGVDYSAPFNPDGIQRGAYKGMVQVDPYWTAPLLNDQAAANPASGQFYLPTWWQINGQRVHHTHCAIMINGDELPDILKPSYMYGGVSVPQKVVERVYAAEKTANEAPQLAMSKRMTVLKMDSTTALANIGKFCRKMTQWLSLQNNFGAKVIDKETEELEQFDTSLTDLDAVIMTQYQLVAAAADVPATKLMGTSPKGFGASGEYESESYHEYLESIQEHDLMPLLEGHYVRLMKSEIMPKFGEVTDPFVEITFKPVNSLDAKELAELNKLKAETDLVLANVGSIDGTDSRQRLINDPESGYTGIEDIVPGGPGDRDAQQEADEPLEQPVSTKVTAKAGGESEE